MSEYEFRTEGTIEVRGEGDEPRKLVGISPPWNTLSTPGAIAGGIRETFERGAFRNLTDDIIATVEHDNANIIGRTSAGTLRLSDTPEGLRYEVDLPDTSAARDLAESIRVGNITRSSFEFRVPGEEGHRLEVVDGVVHRTVKPGGALLRQVGPVAKPAFGDGPAVSLRCQEEIAALTAPKVDEESARERRSQIRAAELELAESQLPA